MPRNKKHEMLVINKSDVQETQTPFLDTLESGKKLVLELEVPKFEFQFSDADLQFTPEELALDKAEQVDQLVTTGWADPSASIGANDKVTFASLPEIKKVKDTKKMSDFVIEDGVPVPEAASRRGRATIFPIASLQPGQSFFVAQKTEGEDTAHRLYPTVAKARKVHAPNTYRVANVEETGKGRGARIWRVS